MSASSHAVNRRHLLGLGVGVGLTLTAPLARLSWAATPAPLNANRFVFVILRGGMDGLGAVPAIGDPDLASTRGPLATGPTPALPLDNTFALHPALSQLHSLYQQQQMLVVHAVGLQYRERSHFDAQNVLEGGGVRPYEWNTGWLGRAIAALPAGGKGMALNTAVPLALRGAASVDTWAPNTLPDPSAELIARVERMYAQDPALANALARAKSLHMESSMGEASSMNPADKGTNFVSLSKRAAEFLAAPQGPQAVMLELGGWDTHANQFAPNGALARNLTQLDKGLAELQAGLVNTPQGNLWQRTVVLVVSEFGREVAMNGTQGTDHGTGGVAFVLGGSLRGGRVMGNWPGLAKKDRFEGRDLRTTTDIRSVIKGVMSDHLQLSTRAVSSVLPASDNIPGLRLFA